MKKDAPKKMSDYRYALVNRKGKIMQRCDDRRYLEAEVRRLNQHRIPVYAEIVDLQQFQVLT